MKKVTIINAYGDKNIGDAAILTVALQFIGEAYKNKCQTSVLCEDTKSVSNILKLSKGISTFQLPYGYAIRGNKKVSYLTKIARFTSIYINTYIKILLNKYFLVGLPKKGFYSYINEIKEADIIVGMGGGYFTSTDKIKDYFGLLLSLLTVYVAKFYKKKIVFYPISFGPFASKAQENMAYRALINTTVITRDKITLNAIVSIDKNKLIKAFYAPDLALFYSAVPSDTKTKKDSKYIVLTAREWFTDKSKQDFYENSLIKFIDAINNKYGLNTIFIPMARNPIEDDDNRVALRIAKNLKNKKIFSVISPDSLKDVQTILSNAKIAVCTRMHSAILSATACTPFIAIGYGHKTLGFVRSFELEKWHIDIKDVRFENLRSKFNQLNSEKNYNNFREVLLKKIKDVQMYRNKIIKALD